MSEPVIPFDLTRMFVGDQPLLFFAEIVFRTVVIYGYAFLLVRWVGGRSIAQLSVVEFILVIALGSAVGDPLFYPDVPILHAMTVITVVVLLNKGLDSLIFKFTSVQQVIDGMPLLIVKDGVLLTDNAAARKLGQAEIYEQLRLARIENLGEVANAYLESNGRISVFKTHTPVDSTQIVPPPKTDLRANGQ